MIQQLQIYCMAVGSGVRLQMKDFDCSRSPADLIITAVWLNIIMGIVLVMLT